MKTFIKISTLKKNARREVEKYTNTQAQGTKLINSLLGAPATNLQWFNKARGHYQAAKESNSKERITHLINALFELFKAGLLMEHSRFRDENVLKLTELVQKKYLEETFSFLKTKISSKQQFANEEVLGQALAVLEEVSPEQAKNFHSLWQSIPKQRKIIETLQVVLGEGKRTTMNELLQISRLLKANRELLGANAFLQETAATLLRRYLDKNLADFYRQNPQELPEHFDFYETFKQTYALLKPWAKAKRYDDFLGKFAAYETYNDFIKRKMPQIEKLHAYLSLPRRQVPQAEVNEYLTEIESFLTKYPDSEHELQEKLRSFARFFEEILLDDGKELFFFYSGEFNKLLNLSASKSRTKQLLQLFTKLKAENANCKKNRLVQRRLEKLQREVEAEFYDSLEKKLNEPTDFNKKVEAYDDALECLSEWGDVDTTIFLQAKKREFLQSGTQQKEVLLRPYLHRHAALFHGEALPYGKKQAWLIADRFDRNELIVFTKEQIIIGSDNTCDIVLRHAAIAPRHLKIDFKEAMMEDLHTESGSYINGKKFDKHTLHSDFCLGQHFEVYLKKIEHSIYLKINIPVETEEAFEFLNHTEYLFLAENEEISLHKVSGNLNQPYRRRYEVVELKNIDGILHVTDSERDVIEQAIEQDYLSLTDRFIFSVL